MKLQPFSSVCVTYQVLIEHLIFGLLSFLCHEYSAILVDLVLHLTVIKKRVLRIKIIEERTGIFQQSAPPLDFYRFLLPLRYSVLGNDALTRLYHEEAFGHFALPLDEITKLEINLLHIHSYWQQLLLSQTLK